MHIPRAQRHLGSKPPSPSVTPAVPRASHAKLRWFGRPGAATVSPANAEGHRGAQAPSSSPYQLPRLWMYSQPVSGGTAARLRRSDTNRKGILHSQPQLRPRGRPGCERSQIALDKHLRGTTPRRLESGGLLRGWF